MNTHAAAVVGAVVLAAAAGGAYVFADIPGLSNSPTGNLVNAFELSTGSELEVIKTENEGSLTKVTLRQEGANEVIDTYVTSDGKYIVQNPINIGEFTKSLEAREEFISCLSDQNAQFYGIIAGDNEQLAQHTRMTQAQIQALGGQNGLQDIFRGPGTEGFPQEQVVNNGIVWKLNGELSAGMKTTQQLEEATGCSYDAPGA